MADLQSRWTNWAVSLACTLEGSFWSGARLISSNKTLIVPALDDSIKIEALGYTRYKLTRLHDQYFVPDSVNTAMMLHERNIARRKYASAAFHCYGHLLKATFENRSKRGSVMGPCIQSVIITLMPHQASTKVTVTYRTTEVYKKLPADFVWLKNQILPLIPGQDKYPVNEWRFNFANVTSHPMYFATIIPYLSDPVATLLLIKERNPAFHDWAIKWLARYLIGGAAGRSIEKFAQAQRTAQAAQQLISAEPATLRSMVKYLFDNQRTAIPRSTRFDHAELVQSFTNAWEKVK